MTKFCAESGLVLKANKSSMGIKINPKTRTYNTCRQMNRPLPAAFACSHCFRSICGELNMPKIIAAFPKAGKAFGQLLKAGHYTKNSLAIVGSICCKRFSLARVPTIS